MDENFFIYKDNVEGKVAIGKIPDDLKLDLSDISCLYYKQIPDKNKSTYHTWYSNMNCEIKQKVRKIQDNPFWDNLCDNNLDCFKLSAREMDELYYSNPPNNLKKINLYGAYSNYGIHKDCIFNFDGIKFYRVLIGLTDNNDNVITNFTKFNINHKINKYDYIVFDFDRTEHQVLKEKDKETPRILLKLHYIVSENGKHSKEYVELVKKCYLTYEFITRYIMDTGTDPETFYEFFWGLVCQGYMKTENLYYTLLYSIIIIFYLVKVLKITNVLKITWMLLLSLFCIFIIHVIFYWSRFKISGIK